jgi:hypothetical protein
VRADLWELVFWAVPVVLYATLPFGLLHSEAVGLLGHRGLLSRLCETAVVTVRPAPDTPAVL